MKRGTNIFGFPASEKIPYFVSDPAKTAEENRDELSARLRAVDLDFRSGVCLREVPPDVREKAARTFDLIAARMTSDR